MTGHADLEPAVRAFVREREARRPDPTHLLRHVVRETRTVPQRRHWWQGHAGSGVPSLSGDRRGRVVQPRLLFASLAVMSLLVVTVALALVLSGSDDSPSVGAPASPSPAAADGPTIIVAQDGSGDVTSLSEAIDRAGSGYRVLVRPGRYVEAVTVMADIDILGDGDATDIIIEGAPAGPSGDPPTIVRFEGGTPRLANLTLLPAEWAEDAIAVAGGAPVLEGLVVGSPGLRGAISFYGNAAGGIVRDSIIYGSIAAYAGDGGDEALLIEGNTIIPIQWPNGAERVAIVAGRALDARDNTIQGGDVGIRVEGVSPDIEDNHIEGATRGIVIDGGEPRVAGNTVLATETGLDVALAAPMLTDNDVRDARVAVALLDGTAGTLSGNRISGNEVGIRVDNAWLTTGSPSEVVLGDNDVCDNDVDLEIAPDATVRQDGDGICIVSRPESTAEPGTVSVEEVMAGLETIESADGVVRARADGAGHELAGSQLVASNDAGDIWVFRGENELFQLGRPGTESIEHTAPHPWAMAVAEDGSVWLSTSGGIFSFDGSTWTGHQVFSDGVSRIDAARDGSVWVTWAPWDDASGPHLTVGRYDDGSWTTWESGADDGSLPVAGQFPSGFEVTPDGRAWLSFSGPEAPGLVGFDGERWRIMPAGPGGMTSVEALEEGPNGTLWAILGSGPVPDEDAILATFDGEAWTMRSDEVPEDRREYGVDILVTDDEVLWLSRGLNRRGLHRFDAAGWTQPLETESFLTEKETMHLGLDGTVWVTGEGWRGSPPILIPPS